MVATVAKWPRDDQVHILEIGSTNFEGLPRSGPFCPVTPFDMAVVFEAVLGFNRAVDNWSVDWQPRELSDTSLASMATRLFGAAVAEGPVIGFDLSFRFRYVTATEKERRRAALGGASA
jgi:hypothetical protein